MSGATLARTIWRMDRRGSAALGALALSALLVACKDKPSEVPPAPTPAPAPSAAAAPVDNAPAVTPPPATQSPTLVAKPAAQSGASSQVATESRKIPLSVQGVSAAGATVRVKGMEISNDATVVDVSISFANRITSTTMMALTDTFLEDESGARLPIKRPDDNRNLTVHAGETLNGQLVFMGSIPSSARKMRLVFNEGNPDDNIVAPGLTIDLPLPGG